MGDWGRLGIVTLNLDIPGVAKRENKRDPRTDNDPVAGIFEIDEVHVDEAFEREPTHVVATTHDRPRRAWPLACRRTEGGTIVSGPACTLIADITRQTAVRCCTRPSTHLTSGTACVKIALQCRNRA